MAEKQDLLNRLKTIEGHIRGIQRMVEDDGYCVDILKQTKAVQRALSACRPWSTLSTTSGRPTSRAQRAATIRAAMESPPPETATASGREEAASRGRPKASAARDVRSSSSAPASGRRRPRSSPWRWRADSGC